MIGEDKTCDHKGHLIFTESSLMSNGTLETVMQCTNCNKQMMMVGDGFRRSNEEQPCTRSIGASMKLEAHYYEKLNNEEGDI